MKIDCDRWKDIIRWAQFSGKLSPLSLAKRGFVLHILGYFGPKFDLSRAIRRHAFSLVGQNFTVQPKAAADVAL